VHPGLQTVADAQASITSVAVSVDNEAQTATVTVNFTATDANGNYIPTLGDASASNSSRLAYIRFALAWLKPAAEGSGDPDLWSNQVTPTTNTRGERTYANLTDNQDGTYTYVFSTDMYPLYSDPSNLDLTHRMVLIISGSVVPEAVDALYDFVPSQGPTGPYTFATTRNIVTTQACDGCHGRLGSPLGAASFHGGSRYLAEACPVCHTSELGTNGEAEAMVFYHKIHAANYKGERDVHYCSNDLTQTCTTDADCGEGYTCLGDLGDYTDVTFPQALQDCTKCHQGDPDGDHWKTRPSMRACGSCHNTVNFATGENHLGGAQTDNSQCALCHTSGSTGLAPIPVKHLTENSTPNNPDVPTGLANFEYVLENVTVDENNQAVVTFHINKDGVPLDLSTYPPAGFSGGPSFLVAYAMSQDGVTTPVDYNNLGRTAGQPASVSLASVAANLTGSADSYTVTLASAPFPDGAVMRAVALQGYFTQLAGGSVTDNTARHTPSVVLGVTGDAQRRQVIDAAKCTNCHEWLELHGGNRVVAPETTDVVCTVCHNPNLSSSGRGSDPANLNDANKAALEAAGYDPADPLTYPEATNNFKDMIHGIHAAAHRTFPYEFVRNRGSSGVYFYDWSEVTFPGILSNCETCHKPGTYDADLPAGVLMSTDRTTSVENGQDPTTDAVNEARTTMPNGTDWVNSPTVGACYMCHDSNPAASHFGQNGGFVDANRSAVTGQ